MSDLRVATAQRSHRLPIALPATDVREPVLLIRLVGVLVAAGAAWYLPWLLRTENPRAAWLSWPFVGANFFLVGSALVCIVNNWHRRSPEERLVPVGHEPLVGVIVPTCGEPVEMVRKTLETVLGQDWPPDRLAVAVGDDAHNPAMAAMLADMRRSHPETTLLYYEPPARSSPTRRGDAKSGNLNAGLEILSRWDPDLEFVETRDADDLVGDPLFLRNAVGQLHADRAVAFVQTIKEAVVTDGDPFGNLEAIFYRGSMKGRHAANAVFPCGSGLVWRRSALDGVDGIDGFPGWNLVEDLQSGVEALRRGWRGVYVPIVGAVGQTAPEDIPNVYKQRGTWALDTVRLVVWGDLRGLSLRQRMQFYELALFYFQSFAILVFVLMPVVGLYTGDYPLVTSAGQYAIHFWPVTAAVELVTVALNGRNSWDHLWRSRQMWVGLSPVYVRACVLALLSGPRRKPSYVVTRKTQQVGWYWRETLVQAVLVVALGGAIASAVVTHHLLTDLDLGSMYWAVVSGMFLATFLRKSWHGVGLGPAVARALRGRRVPAPSTVGSR